jgi:hypothetical protein
MRRRELIEIEAAEAEDAERRFVEEAMAYNESRRRRTGADDGDRVPADDR